jgi:hypothetical protein
VRKRFTPQLDSPPRWPRARRLSGYRAAMVSRHSQTR